MFINPRSVVATTTATALLANGFGGFLSMIPACQAQGANEPYVWDFGFSENIHVDGDCNYRLEFTLKHNEDLPIGWTPSNSEIGALENCYVYNETGDFVGFSNATAEIDGVSYLFPRQDYYEFSAEVTAATGLFGINIDFSPCGHIPLEAYGRAHYNYHIYYVDQVYRTGTMNCDGAPLFCVPLEDQTTPEGKAFYEIDYTDGEGSTIRNMPEGFVVDPRTAFPNMGIHAWKVSDDPDDVSTWSEPRLWMGSYDKDIAYLEPMFPLEFVTGDEDNTWEITPTYVEQTIPSLPSKIGMYYNAETGILTNYLEGKSEVCIIGTIDCDSIDTKNECNKKFGCLWQRKKNKNNCGHAKTNTECKKYRNKEKCKKRGCVWNKKADDDKCKSRWEKL